MKMVSLYTIKVEHNYFSNGQPRHLKFATHRESRDLFRRRGLSLHSPDRSTVEVLFDADGGGVDTKNDVIRLTLVSLDPQFSLYTDWAEFNPAAQYRLSLNGDFETEDASKAFEMVAPSREIGAKPFEIAIHPTDEMVERARNGEPMCCTLHFVAPSRYWEYMFVVNSGSTKQLGKSTILARDRILKRNIPFSTFKQGAMDGNVTLCARSEEKIPMRERYMIDVRLEGESQGGAMKPILMLGMDRPEVGRYQSDDLETLRIIIQK